MTRPISVDVEPIFIELPVVSKIVSLGESTVQKLVREEQFPKPRQTSDRRVGWLLREVREWAEARPVSDLPPPANTGKKSRA